MRAMDTGSPLCVASHDVRHPFPLEALVAWPHPATRPLLTEMTSISMLVLTQVPHEISRTSR